jgi:uncharacterized protein
MNRKINAVIGLLLLSSVGLLGCQAGESTPSGTPATTSPFISESPKPVQAEPVSEDVEWSIGDTVVAATITRPNDVAVHPGLVLIPGSGPTDRDWNSTLLPGTNGSARLLAFELAKNGFVTIRYDKRFTGPKASKNLPLLIGKISMESHTEEIAGAVSQLLGRSDVDHSHIYVLANSEGTIHAMHYQLQRVPKFAGIVLAAPPGRNMAELLHSQIEAQVASLPEAQEIMAGYDKMMANFIAGKDFAADPAVPQGISAVVQAFYAPANLPFTRELINVDSAGLLKQVTAPVLVVIGKKDIQVDWQADGALLENASEGRKNVTFVYPENANHVLKNEIRPRSELNSNDALAYNAPEKILDADALKSIQDWLALQVKPE